MRASNQENTVRRGNGDTAWAAVCPGSTMRVVETAMARMHPTGRFERVASEEVRFSRGDVLLVRAEPGDVFASACTDSVRSVLVPQAYMRVVRRLQPGEAAEVLARTRAREEEARRVFVAEVARHRLDMHLSGVEVAHGEARIVFYFTAPGRVDFRGLVRDLAGALHSRIELRQIGVRDEARCNGGLGPCGLPVCCASFLRQFTGVTIKMAKTQGLVLNPQKVSGLCGRLMCCLAFEHECYCEMMKGFPKVGSIVVTPKGEGKVKEVFVMRGAIRVAVAPGQIEEVAVKDVRPKGGASDQPAPVETAADESEDAADLKGLED